MTRWAAVEELEDRLLEERRARQLRAIPGLVEPADYLCTACADEGVLDMGAVAIVRGEPLCRVHARDAGWCEPVALVMEAAE